MFFASIISDYFISQLLRSWFAPFKRTTERRGDRFSLEDLAAYIVINTMSRVIGAITRTMIILIGLLVFILVIIGGFFIYLFWMVAPFMIIGLLGASISLFII